MKFMNSALLAVATICGATASAETIYNGDIVNGVPVITQLDVNDLPKNKVHRFMFKGTDMVTTQAWYVPVIVAKGNNEGKKLLLSSVVHGDEINGLRVIQSVMEQIKTEELNGTVVGVLGANPNGLIHNSRYFSTTSNNTPYDMNRVFPGKENGNSAEKHAWLLWNKLIKNNTDYALDFHTQSTGDAYPLFIYADYRNPEIKKMAELFPADQIKADPGEKGSLETTFVENNIPAMTVELGSPKLYQKDMIERGIQGTQNVMISLGMVKGNITSTAKDMNTFIGNRMLSVRAQTAGIAEILVSIGEDVKQGQKIALQRNAFGDIIKEYTAPVDGKVLSLGTDPVRDANSLLVRILYIDKNPECEKGC